ncbi:MAG: hypothetical protein FJ088_10380 [Deltaproteobacteria bacterium]|nr:hypothetical protein [Deltaproteobacteria bacterium]
MNKRAFFLSVAIFASLFLQSLPARGQSANQCVSCHQNLQKKELAKYFDLWKNSVHEKKGIFCEACHGGDPGASEKGKAHAGILPSDDEKSGIYPRNVPATCGKCHPAELNDFKQSLHYTQLVKANAGPTCATCHQGKTGFILNGALIAETCKDCHSKMKDEQKWIPEKAHLLMVMTKQVSVLLDWAKDYVDSQKLDAEKKSKLKKTLKNIETLNKSGYRWHTFNMHDYENSLSKAFSEVIEIRDQAGK